MNIDLENLNIEDFDFSFDLAKYTSSVVDTAQGREIIIEVLDNWSRLNENTQNIWLDLVERAGYYPYFKQKKEAANYQGSIQGQIRAEYFKSDNLDDIYFHRYQKEIDYLITNKKNVAVSAPTSFGKSLLIEEIIAKDLYNNIVIIQPTLALIDETRKKLKKYSKYNIIVNTQQVPGDQNIFILTAERVLEIYPKLPKIDFLVVDEFYKISNKHDNRIDSLNIAIYRIMMMKAQGLFLTPVVDSISQEFLKKYDIIFFRTEYSLVNTRVHKKIVWKNAKERKNKLYELLFDLKDEQTIVFVSSQNEGYMLANEFLNFLDENHGLPTTKYFDLFDWIDENISKDWNLKKFLSYGIGVHNGDLPRHLGNAQVELFNSKSLNVLFATTTLIEGVNTSAKNMIIYSKNKAKIPVNYFEFTNIKGRAGRMNQYYTGDIYLFHDAPEKTEELIIDVPVIEQTEETSDEIIVNILEEDLKVDTRDRANSLLDNDPELNKLMKNNLINIKGQISLANYIESNLLVMKRYLTWSHIPAREELKKTLELAYSYLQEKVVNDKYLNRQSVKSLMFLNVPLAVQIQDDIKYKKSKGEKKPIEKAISDNLKFWRRDASFEIPKLLGVVDSLQKYIFGKYDIKSGDYSFFITSLENENVNENLRFLIDLGIPASAIRKIQGEISSELDEHEVVEKINKSIEKKEILKYERDLIVKAIK